MRWVATTIVVLAATTATAKDRYGCKWQPPHRDRVAKLKAPTEIAARIARADVAHLGTSAVAALSQAYHGKTISKQTARDIVGAMLVESVPLSYMQSNRPLFKLIDTTTARAIAAPLFAANAYDSGAVGLRPRPVKLNPVRQAIKDLAQRGGDAVVIAYELIREEHHPGRRLFGAEILVRLGAVGQRRTLENLRARDRGKVHISHGCVVEPSTVGRRVGEWLDRTAPFKTPTGKGAVCRDAERYLRWVFPEQTPAQRAAFVNQLRQGGTWQATSFADYWRRATPLLNRALNPRKPIRCRCRKRGCKKRGNR